MVEGYSNRVKLLVLGGLSSAAWLCYVRSTQVVKRPNIQPPGPVPQNGLQKGSGHYVQLSKGRTFYRLYNEHCSSTLPPILLCHGFMGSSEYLIPLIEGLLPTQRLIYALDLYGRGHSDCVDEDYNYDLFTEQISELLGALAIRGPIDLVGYSMGGGIAVRFGALNLPLLRSLTLIAPVGLPSMTIGPSYKLKFVLKILKYGSFAVFGGYLHEWLTAEVIHLSSTVLSQGWTRVDTPRFQWYEQHMRRRFDNERETLPRAVASTILNLPFDSLSASYATVGEGTPLKPLPVLALWGQKDQSVPCDGGGLKRYIPHAQVITWANEGHMLPVELAEEVAEQMLNFWQQHEENNYCDASCSQ